MREWFSLILIRNGAVLPGFARIGACFAAVPARSRTMHAPGQGTNCSSSPISESSKSQRVGGVTVPPCARANVSSYAKKRPSMSSAGLGHLARYTHRVGDPPTGRLLDSRRDHVSFRWKDISRGEEKRTVHRSKVMRLDVGEFMRRFLSTVPPIRLSSHPVTSVCSPTAIAPKPELVDGLSMCLTAKPRRSGSSASRPDFCAGQDGRTARRTTIGNHPSERWPKPHPPGPARSNRERPGGF